MNFLKLSLFFFLLVGSHPIITQNFKLNHAKSKLTVSGTSTMHNWHIKATLLDGNGVFIINSGVLNNITSLTFTVAVAALKGEKKGMNKKIQVALNAKTQQTINYRLNRIMDITKIDAHHFSAKTSGRLTIAGFSNKIDLLLQFEIRNHTIRISGNKKLKMTDFNIKPPKALLGMLKTGNEVKVVFDVIYQ